VILVRKRVREQRAEGVVHIDIGTMNKAMMSLALALGMLALSANALELTPKNWDEHTAGKTVFIKFLAPW